jgi:hypothetical protein
MENLIVAVLVVAALAGWIVIAGRRDETGTRPDPWWQRHRVLLAAIGVGVIAGNLTLDTFGGSRPDEPVLDVLATLFGMAGILVILGILGWMVTWASRRRLRRLDGQGAEPVVLHGRSLAVVRGVWLVLFAAVAVVFVANLGALWSEASTVRRVPVPYDEFLGDGFFAMSVAEARNVGGSTVAFGLEAPRWYPTLVVVRQAAVYAAALGISWFVFSRRPRHWMAFFVSIFIVLAALGPVNGVRTAEMGDGFGFLGGILQILAGLSLGAFLWVFPDGRFRGTYLRLVVVCMAIAVPAGMFLGELAWFVFVLLLGALVAGGIAVQVFRYRHASPQNRKNARLVLATLGLLVLWLVAGGTTLYAVFAGANWPAFLWRQTHLTLFLVTPVLIGLWVLWLVRSQGWWDLDLFVNRGAVFAIVTPVLGLLYLGVVLAIGGMFSAWTDQNGTALAVVAATIAVAFAYRPTRRVVQEAIDRRFFPERTRSAALLAEFGNELRSDVDQVSARDRLVETVTEALEPATVVVLLRPFTPLGGEL